MKKKMQLNRRIFLQGMVSLVSGLGCSSLFSSELSRNKASAPREAMFYKNLDRQTVLCLLCPRGCVINEGKRGFCRNRENQGGKLYSVVYGKPCAVDVGPIEKAPFYHFAPGHYRLCLTCASCNLRCKYCQNWHLSQRSVEELHYYSYSPSQIIQKAKDRKLNSISFTYTEPTVYYEYLYDIAVLAKQNGIKTSIVSNGYINREPLLKLIAVLDAVKIDLKGFSEKFYQEVCSATLKPVLDSLLTVKQNNTWLEIVNLLVPTLNDDLKMIEAMVEWIKNNLGAETPIHFSRFFPQYRLTQLSATPISVLESAANTASRQGLKYVYIGNVPGHPRNSTFCPSCGKRVIHRTHFDIHEMRIVDGKCYFCKSQLHGKWT